MKEQFVLFQFGIIRSNFTSLQRLFAVKEHSFGLSRHIPTGMRMHASATKTAVKLNFLPSIFLRPGYILICKFLPPPCRWISTLHNFRTGPSCRRHTGINQRHLAVGEVGGGDFEKFKLGSDAAITV